MKSFVNISKKIGIKLIDYRFVKRYNGNIRVYFKNTGKIYKSKNKINEKLKLKKIINRVKYLQSRINYWKLNKIKQLNEIVKLNGPVAAKAFPGRASIILNLLNLDLSLFHLYMKKTLH